MNMITLAARAILKRRYYEPELHGDLESFYASCYSEHVMEAEAEARAVIAAIREMLSAADETFLELVADRMHDGRFSVSGETYPVLRNFLRAFVDAALASPPTPEDAGER